VTGSPSLRRAVVDQLAAAGSPAYADALTTYGRTLQQRNSLLRAIRGADKALITDVRLFDRFESADGLSLAFEVTLQPAEKSFTDEQIGDATMRIVAAAEKVGARLRT